MTDASDCDFLVLVHGLAPHNRITKAIQQVADLAREKRYGDVGTQGVFGDFAIGTELMARIGLDADTNVNTTRRLLVLFESVPVFNEDVRTDLIRQLLERYCTDYDPASGRRNHDRIKVPRFLLNDLIRYWRTMAVDFGAKQWRSVRTEWHLRYVKLLTTRKILYAGSLMSLLRTPDMVAASETPEQFQQLLSYLTTECDRTPLARLMAAHPQLTDPGRDGLARVLSAYESLMARYSLPGHVAGSLRIQTVPVNEPNRCKKGFCRWQARYKTVWKRCSLTTSPSVTERSTTDSSETRKEIDGRT